MKIHVLSVGVFKNPLGDCTNSGISSRFDELLVSCPDGNESFDPAVEVPLNFCMVSWILGNAHLVPATVSETGRVVARPGWFMYGGNIAETSDSRFHDLTGVRYPLHIHDRREA